MKLSRKELTEKVNRLQERFNFFENNIFFETIKDNVYIKAVDYSCMRDEIYLFSIFVPLKASTQKNAIIGNRIHVSRKQNEYVLDLNTIFQRKISISDQNYIDIDDLKRYEIINSKDMVSFFKNIE